ncbi:MAG: DegT/DnrJ/EryC1/StrS family aminotransferase [Candidatus Margulisbacteria bacterium]|nr:DegT/DnrJ/EryC1/StrS family aminotransferase [Candidatus Margulisiibacteriota bacterium]
MKVEFSYLNRQFKQAGPGEDPRAFYTDLIFNDLKEFIKSGDFTLGRKLEEFEEKFARLIGVKHAVGVNSGTDALILSLKALGIGPGDEVITCAETFIATAGAIAAVGARPVFVDVNAEFTIDAGLIEAAITKKTKALLPVWFTGNAPDLPAILRLGKKYGLPVVEDSCCAIDAAIGGKKAGSFGATGTFSFHPLKNLNVWSDGGLVTTDSGEIAAKLKLLRNHGLKNRDEVEIFGVNSRLDTLQAVVALRLFGDVAKITDARIAVAKKYDEAFSALPGFIDVPKRHDNVRHVFHLYMVRAKERDGLLAHCLEQGIEAKIHYPIPLPYQKCCAQLGYKKGDFPATERDCGSIITLPAHQHLTEAEVQYVIDTVREFYKK